MFLRSHFILIVFAIWKTLCAENKLRFSWEFAMIPGICEKCRYACISMVVTSFYTVSVSMVITNFCSVNVSMVIISLQRCTVSLAIIFLDSTKTILKISGKVWNCRTGPNQWIFVTESYWMLARNSLPPFLSIFITNI